MERKEECGRSSGPSPGQRPLGVPKRVSVDDPGWAPEVQLWVTLESRLSCPRSRDGGESCVEGSGATVLLGSRTPTPPSHPPFWTYGPTLLS